MYTVPVSSTPNTNCSQVKGVGRHHTCDVWIGPTVYRFDEVRTIYVAIYFPIYPTPYPKENEEEEKEEALASN